MTRLPCRCCPMGEGCHPAEGRDLQSGLASLQALSAILWCVCVCVCTATTQMRTALTQRDLKPPAARTLNHQPAPHTTHERAESVYQQFCSEHTPPASLLPGENTPSLLPGSAPGEPGNLYLLQNDAFVCSCYRGDPGSLEKPDWNAAEAHNSDLLPPNYMINVTLRLQPPCQWSAPPPETAWTRPRGGGLIARKNLRMLY